MTTLILVRHGESEANRQSIFAGHLDAVLMPKGVEQARITAEYVVQNYKVDKVYASDLKRAYETGKCVSDLLHIDIIPEKDLREIDAGSWNGESFEVLLTDSRFADDYHVWMTDIGKSRCTDGESVKELSERVMNCLNRIADENDGKTVAVATHATPIRIFQTLVQTGTLSQMKNIPWVSNASVTVAEYENGNWILKLVSEDSHLGQARTDLPKNV